MHNPPSPPTNASTPSTLSPTSSLYNLALPPPPAAPSDSRILLIMTGGTICMQPSPSGLIPARGFLDTCLRPRPVFNDSSPPLSIPVTDLSGTVTPTPSLRTPPSKYGRRIRYAALEFNPLLDSSSIDAKGWAMIARAIEKNYQNFDAFVVLHGTDSLAYTCSALSFMCEDLGKPVVFTGSQAPMQELYSDATDNLLGSLLLAGHYMIPEVCLFFADKLFRGNRATKSNAHDFNAFSSPNLPPLAKVGVTTKVNWELVYRPREIRGFRVHTELETSHVACLRVFPGIMPEMVRGVLGLEGLRGLVLETFGSGNAPEDERLIGVLREAVGRGVVVVSVTQCQVGSVSPLYASGTKLANAGVVFGLDMTSEAALTKLAVLLANPALTPAEIRHLMSKSLRGELTESSSPSFAHPDGDSSLPPILSALSSLGYAIQARNREECKALLQRKDTGGVFLLNQFDYMGNTPLHLASTARNLDILRDFLKMGASVHLRNRNGHTPLFLAAEIGWKEAVELLRESGAHLSPEEMAMARSRHGGCWETAGIPRE